MNPSSDQIEAPAGSHCRRALVPDNDSKERAALSWPVIIGYCIGSSGMGVFSTVPGLLLLFFLTEVIGIAPATAGSAILIAKGASIISDPFAGWLCETMQTRWGPRLPFLLAGGMMMAAGNFFLFAPPLDWTANSAFAFSFAAYLFATIGASLFEVPYATLPAEMADESAQRTWIVTVRSAFVLIGVLIGATVIPSLIPILGGGRQGYASMSAVLGLGLTLTALITIVTVNRIALKERTNTAFANGPAEFALCIRHRPLLWPMLANCLQVAALSLSFALVPYLAIIVRGGSESEAGTMLAAIVLVAIVAMPGWAKLGLKLGHPSAHAIGGTAFGVGTCLLATASAADISSFFYIGMTLMGLGFGAIQLSPYAMLAEVTNAFGTREGAGREAMLTGLWTAFEKFALALGPFLAGILLSAGNHWSEFGFGKPEAVLFGLSVLPAALVITSWLPLCFAKDALPANRKDGKS